MLETLHSTCMFIWNCWIPWIPFHSTMEFGIFGLQWNPIDLIIQPFHQKTHFVWQNSWWNPVASIGITGMEWIPWIPVGIWGAIKSPPSCKQSYYEVSCVVTSYNLDSPSLQIWPWISRLDRTIVHVDLKMHPLHSNYLHVCPFLM